MVEIKRINEPLSLAPLPSIESWANSARRSAGPDSGHGSAISANHTFGVNCSTAQMNRRDAMNAERERL